MSMIMSTMQKWLMDPLLNVVIGCIMPKSMSQYHVFDGFAAHHQPNNSHNSRSYLHAVQQAISFAMMLPANANLLGRPTLSGLR